MRYIKSPLSYTGGKYAILSDLINIFPKQINTFVDLFAGGFNVGINVEANKIICNDHAACLAELYKMFSENSVESIIAEINKIIDEYDLPSRYSLTQTGGESYKNLRNSYNKTKNSLYLFVLICYSFNHQIRFNTKNEFNMPFGKARSDFNKTTEYNLIRFCRALRAKNIQFESKDFMDIDLSTLGENDLVYCDPPYLISTASYNDGERWVKDWTETEEQQLLRLLDELNGRGVKFALSNVLHHKGQSNEILIEWSKKYNVIDIDKHYANCSYRLKTKGDKSLTEEILVINYEHAGYGKQLSIFDVFN